MGLSVSKVSVKKNLKTGDDSYYNDFESMGDSKSMSNNTEATVVCFMCKKNIPKSQALAHNKVCTKVQTSKSQGSKKQEEGKKYSPIREDEDEEA
jgi:hypothetical protein